MKFTIQHSLGQEKLWNVFTTNEFTTKWLAVESTINWKKNGRVKLTIDPRSHKITGCKILEFTPFQKVIINWKGPEKFDITMNFEEYLTHLSFTFTDTAFVLDHDGWRSSEDWQEAKDWHEKVFWPGKIAKLTEIIQGS